MKKYSVMAIAGILIFTFSSCTAFKSSMPGSSSSSSTGGTIIPIGSGGDSSTVAPVAGASTLSIQHFGQIQESLKKLTCVTPNANLKEEQYILNPIYSQNGLVTSVSQTVQMATMRISSKFCEEAFTREQNIASSNRCVYKSVNFAAGPEQFSNVVLEQMVKEITKRFWAKDITADELSIFVNGLNTVSSASSQSGLNKVRELAVVTCTLAFNSVNGLLM